MQKSKKLLYTILGVSGVWGAAAIATAVAVAYHIDDDQAAANNWKVTVSQSELSDSTEVKLDIKDLNSQFINNPLQLYYKEVDNKEASEKVLVWTPKNPSEQITLGGLKNGTNYQYRLQSGTEILTQGTLSTKAQPTFALRGTTDKQIQFLISNIDAGFLGSTLTVRYALADKPDEVLGKLDISISEIDRKIGTPYYEVLGTIQSGIEPGKKYIIEVNNKNIAGKLTWTLVAQAKEIPTATLVKAYSYSADLQISGLRSYIEANSRDVQFLVSYSKAGETTAKSLPLQLGQNDPLVFSLSNLDAEASYTAKIFMVQGNAQTQIGGDLNITTLGAVTPVAASMTYNSLVSANFTMASNLGDIAKLKFVWVAKPQNGQPVYLVTNSISMEADTTTSTTGIVKSSAGKLDNLRSGTTYVAQIFSEDDIEFKKPLLKTAYEFTTLSSLQINVTPTNLEVVGLHQLSTQEINFVFKEVVATGGTASGTTPTDVKVTATTATVAQNVALTSAGLTDGKTYTVNAYLTGDTEKEHSLFAPFTFTKATAPAATAS